MAEISFEEIKSTALELISENQEDFHSDDDRNILLYVAAFNDGVLEMVEKIANKFFPVIKGFDPKEAADEEED